MVTDTQRAYVNDLLSKAVGNVCAASLLIRRDHLRDEESDLIANRLWDLGLQLEEYIKYEEEV